ncbi:ataxin-7 isoform X2 [Phodopus roborovskii]|uniref:ataxin-7 isoform X2 n=1 Tax=Phodopus roborovskii TaxID=109678 RepID=UPI0021E4E128|nr:ataxin-7 isoform X2 [Phodopus roborovskii]
MSERAADDVRGEPRRAAGGAAAARQQQQQPPQPLQPQRQHPPPRRPRPEDGGSGAATTSAAAMATVGERRPLPSPEAMLGQSWNLWVEASKLPGKDDMPIFGLCPAHDDFYLVVCNDCNQVVKPQAFQSHYERRHSSSSKPSLAVPHPSVFSLFPSLSKSKGGSANSRPSGAGSLCTAASSSKLLKLPKEKLQLRGSIRPMHPTQQTKVPHGRVMTPSVKVEKMHPKMDGTLLKSTVGPACPAAVSSAVKSGLNCPSIPKPTLPSPGQILNGKGLPATPTLEKKPEDSSNNRKFLNKRLSEREFDPDIHCGVIDLETKKPCTRSLTCKTHSLTQRRAVQGRRKRFDVLLAEHKNKAREKELIRHPDSQQPPHPLRDPHPTPPRMLPQEPHLSSESKPFVASKPKPHTPSLPRPPGCPAQQGGSTPIDPPPGHESPHPPLPATEPVSRLSSEEGEGDDKEESVEKLDCHYSGHHPQPASFCTFGSRQIGRGYYVFDSRWNRLRCALNLMVEKHLNAQLWKKIPPVPCTTSPVSTRVPHRTNSVPTSQGGISYFAATTVSTSPVMLSSACISPNSKSVPAHGTTLNAQPAASGAMDPVCSMQSRQVSASSSSPSTPSGLSSVPSSPLSRKPQKLKPSKSVRPKESSGNSSNCHNASSSTGGGSGKKRKSNSPLLVRSSSSSSPSSSSPSSSHSVDSFRKNCVAHSGTPYLSTATSSHSLGLNCVTKQAHSVSLRHEQAGRGPPGVSPVEPIKRMSVMVNSSDSTLSLGPFVHQTSELPVTSQGTFPHSHTPLDKLIGKKRKCSAGSSNAGNSGSRPTKVAKLPAMNNVHMKHTGAIPGAQGLTNNSLLHQPKARP